MKLSMIKINYSFKTKKWSLWKKIKERLKPHYRNKQIASPIIAKYYTLGYYKYNTKIVTVFLGSIKTILSHNSFLLINNVIDVIIHESLHGTLHDIKMNGKGNEEWIIDKLEWR